MIRALHFAKTSWGAVWALNQMRALRQMGVDVHAALPTDGSLISQYVEAGIEVHPLQIGIGLMEPLLSSSLHDKIRKIVTAVNPDVVHSHFVSTTVALRLALRGRCAIPRIFQVPGPLHLEHYFPRKLELCTSTHHDSWVASSKFTQKLYQNAGIVQGNLFLSYYGMDYEEKSKPIDSHLRDMIEARDNEIIVGNVSWMYPPKYYLGQRVGLKQHELLIDALALVTKERPNVLGVLVGGAWGKANWYEQRLRKRAWAIAGNRIRFTGPLSGTQSRHIWTGIDLAVHVPMSENCGGVVEPLHHGVPVLASDVGGLPEVVMQGRTGFLFRGRDPLALAHAIGSVLDDPQKARKTAEIGQRLVRVMFDVRRTAGEILSVYRHLLGDRSNSIAIFDPVAFVSDLEAEVSRGTNH